MVLLLMRGRNDISLSPDFSCREGKTIFLVN